MAIRFNIHHSSLCIINSHLAAHMDEVEKRNQVSTELNIYEGCKSADTSTCRQKRQYFVYQFSLHPSLLLSLPFSLPFPSLPLSLSPPLSLSLSRSLSLSPSLSLSLLLPPLSLSLPPFSLLSIGLSSDLQ